MKIRLTIIKPAIIKPVMILVVLILTSGDAGAQDTIRHFTELENRTLAGSLTLRKGDLQLSQAKAEKIAAVLGVIDPSGSVTGTIINNLRLPVNLIPAEILGGEAGTFREIRFGTRYQTSLNAYGEIKLVNLQGWENLQQSNINLRASESDRKLSKKKLLENAASLYYGIINLQEQLRAFRLNLLSADTLLTYTLNKFSNGLAGIQELNDSKANKLSVEESIIQLQYRISQEYNALKILCDIQGNPVIAQPVVPYEPVGQPDILNNTLASDNAKEKAELAASVLDFQKYSFAPSLSLFASYQKQQFNSQAKFPDKNAGWNTSSYIGIKLSIPLPGAEMFRQTARAEYNSLIAQDYAGQMKTRAEMDNIQLQADYQNALLQLKNSREVFYLMRESYRKREMNYREGITGIEQAINSFKAMVNSEYNYISSAVNLMLVMENININNKIN